MYYLRYRRFGKDQSKNYLNREHCVFWTMFTGTLNGVEWAYMLDLSTGEVLLDYSNQQCNYISEELS